MQQLELGTLSSPIPNLSLMPIFTAWPQSTQERAIVLALTPSSTTQFQLTSLLFSKIGGSRSIPDTLSGTQKTVLESIKHESKKSFRLIVGV